MTGSQAPPTQSSTDAARHAREAEMYDEGRVWQTSNSWNQRVSHVFLGANTAAGEQRFRTLLSERVRGRRVMDVGCGTGALTGELHAMGASSVYGFDVSQKEIETARSNYGDLPGVTFAVHGAEEPIPGEFDVIAGRSVLHHFDFHSALPLLFERNLARGGRMVFMEPMSHPMTLAFHRFVRSAHTPDEWPLTPADVTWLRERFGARVVSVNLLSFPAGVFSSFFLSSPDNMLMHFADRVDRWLERRRYLLARGRQGIIVIDRPGAPRAGQPRFTMKPGVSTSTEAPSTHAGRDA
jgi:2-polyprenyl-3-methyl-5-hydroxy-6-metoxy-1,4-benzoquinol methylase